MVEKETLPIPPQGGQLVEGSIILFGVSDYVSMGFNIASP